MVRTYDRDAIPSVYDLSKAPTVRERPGFEQVVFRGIDQMIGLTKVTPELEDAEAHTHPYEQVNMLIEGRVDLLIDGERVELEPYHALVVPPEIPHTARAVEGESATLIVFWPLREDRLHGTEYQREFPQS